MRYSVHCAEKDAYLEIKQYQNRHGPESKMEDLTQPARTDVLSYILYWQIDTISGVTVKDN